MDSNHANQHGLLKWRHWGILYQQHSKRKCRHVLFHGWHWNKVCCFKWSLKKTAIPSENVWINTEISEFTILLTQQAVHKVKAIRYSHWNQIEDQKYQGVMLLLTLPTGSHIDMLTANSHQSSCWAEQNTLLQQLPACHYNWWYDNEAIAHKGVSRHWIDPKNTTATILNKEYIL